ncbi:twin-arginine translocase subunit TatC [Halosimplex pelagicum]|uniref:Twin-arginine translocase subunit TatC n=1 Tax=Halosimplex pelagicum TaxID=869886 RepID=A0A7D5T7A5_9EURY|nr:twin-arginine translocase subunit TatC [Halosimplex pelagicum]QLH80110.1 twin-arginine translocase subunit TatC [Halosimplex pelagicum]
MTGSPTRERAAGGGSAVGSVLGEARNDLWALLAAALAFLFGSLTTFLTMHRIVWPVLKRDAIAAVGAETGIIDLTPFDVIFLKAQVALAVGLLFALEAVVYRARRTPELRRWWPGDPLPATVRVGLVLVGVALFPVGAILGYDHLVPVVFEFAMGSDPSWLIVRWARIASVTSFASGLAAQLALVGVVVSLGSRGEDGRSG